MVMTQAGLNKIRDLHATNIDKGWVGTSGTAPLESQTGLQNGITTTKIAVTVSKENKTNVVEYTLPSTVSTSETYREFAAILDGDTEYNRVVFTGVEHTANEDIVVRQTFFYRNP